MRVPTVFGEGGSNDFFWPTCICATPRHICICPPQPKKSHPSPGESHSLSHTTSIRTQPHLTAAASPAACTYYDAALVGQRLEALWGPEGEEQWYKATVVAFMPRARDHVMHFDDGHVERVSLPTHVPTDLSSLRMLDERVECCRCALLLRRRCRLGTAAAHAIAHNVP